jgi:protein TonB
MLRREKPEEASMYQTFKPHRENRLVGVSAAVVVTALAAAGISSGLAREIFLEPETETIMTIIEAPENTVEPVEVVTPEIDEIDVKPDMKPIEIVIPDIQFEIPDATPIIATPEPAPAPTPTGGSDTFGPKLIVSNKPPYPPASVRAQEQGTTSLSVCVDERGRTSSVQVTKSSGYTRLDEAALAWMKQARFRPAKQSGSVRAVCGHQVAYQWDLEDAR